MSYRIKDRLEIAIFFDGKEFPLDRVNVFNFLHMSSSTRLGLPMVRLSLLDSVHWLTKNVSLADGVKIQVVIKVKDKPTTYKFRLNLHKTEIAASGIQYDIDGYLDAPRYWLESSTTPIRGSSYDVLGTVAQQTGLTYDGTRTADVQLWHPMSKKFFHFVREVVDHGYKDSKSCMQSAVTLGGELRYRDVSQVLPVKGRFVSSKYRNGTFIATDYKPKSFSGLMNALSGYASEFYAPSIHTDDSVTKDKVSVSKRNTQLAMNSALHKNIGKSAVQFRPIDCGNVHAKYEEAIYQNRRLSNLYSMGVELVTPDVTGLEPLDWVSFEAGTPSDKAQNRPLSGDYLVASKAIYIQGINYFEKFELYRMGIDARIPGQE